MQVKCGALSISSLRVKVFVPHVALFMHKYLPMGRNRRIFSNISFLNLCYVLPFFILKNSIKMQTIQSN